jgi:hypothetical protein
MCVCVSQCVCVCVSQCMCVWASARVCVSQYMCVCVCARTQVCVYVSMHKCACYVLVRVRFAVFTYLRRKETGLAQQTKHLCRFASERRHLSAMFALLTNKWSLRKQRAFSSPTTPDEVAIGLYRRPSRVVEKMNYSSTFIFLSWTILIRFRSIRPMVNTPHETCLSP